MGIAFRDDNDELRKQVNTVLSVMRTDGTLTSISEKWFTGQDITVE
jgi:ABC-type amino acid transport substrate-binding protein